MDSARFLITSKEPENCEKCGCKLSSFFVEKEGLAPQKRALCCYNCGLALILNINSPNIYKVSTIHEFYEELKKDYEKKIQGQNQDFKNVNIDEIPNFDEDYNEFDDDQISIENDFDILTENLDNEEQKSIDSNSVATVAMVKSYEKITLDYSPLISEFIGIMLGDGHLSEERNVTSVALNRVDDPEYVKYVFKMMKKIFPMHYIQVLGTPYFCSKCNNTHTQNDSIYLDHLNYSFLKRGIGEEKGIHLQLRTVSAHDALTNLGLIPGNKVQNKIKVPSLILESKNDLLKIKCLKGLFDTDGTIFVKDVFNKKNQKHYPLLSIKFANGSRPLVESFAILCSDLEIHKSEVLGPYKYKAGEIYEFHIRNKFDVRAFINLIDPQKIKEPFRFFYLGCRLLYLSCSNNIINQINDRIKVDFPREWDRRYSKEFSLYLTKLCEKFFLDNGIKEILGFKFAGEISKDMILEAIHKSLDYRESIFKAFLEYYKKFPNEENSFYYAHFPEVDKTVIRNCKMRARRLIYEESLNNISEE